jgi:alkylhydroperoxidase family enzyme
MSPRIPRIEMEALPPEVAEALGPRMRRLGYLGEFFKCAAHQPDALLAFMAFTEAGKGGLPERLVEVVALTAAVRAENAYERNQHERLSVRRGYGRDWVAAVERLEPHEAGLAPDEAAVQAYVLAALARSGHGSQAEFEAMIDAVGPEQAMAAMMVLGRYLTHALIVNTLALQPPVPSVFEDGFEG